MPRALSADNPLHLLPDVDDVDDSIAITDLVRSAEASRLRRRGAMRIHDSPHQRRRSQPHPNDPNYYQSTQDGHENENDYDYDYNPNDIPSLQPVSDSEDSYSDLPSPAFYRDNPLAVSDDDNATPTTHTAMLMRSQHGPSYDLTCGTPHYAFATPTTSFKPRPIPGLSLPTTAMISPHRQNSAVPPPPPLRTSTGCGSWLASAFHHRDAYYIPSSSHADHRHHDNAEEATVPVDLSYVDSSLLGLTQPIKSRCLKGQCGCFRTGLSCGSCGNVIGIVYRPCMTARVALGLLDHARIKSFHIFFPENVTSSMSSPTKPPSEISEWFTYHLPSQPSSLPTQPSPPRSEAREDEYEFSRRLVGDGTRNSPQFVSEEHSHPHFTLIDRASRDARGEPERERDNAPSTSASATATSSTTALGSGRRIRGGRRVPIRRDALLTPPNETPSNENEPFSQDWFGDGVRRLVSPNGNSEEQRVPSRDGSDQDEGEDVARRFSEARAAAERIVARHTATSTSTTTTIPTAGPVTDMDLDSAHRLLPLRQATFNAPYLQWPTHGEQGSESWDRWYMMMGYLDYNRRHLEMALQGSRSTGRSSNNGAGMSRDTGSVAEAESWVPLMYIGNEEMEEVGYDVGEYVLVNGSWVAVDPYGIFLDSGNAAEGKQEDSGGDDGRGDTKEDNSGLEFGSRLPRIILATC